MRHIVKGAAPAVLAGTGDEFQDAAVEFAETGATDADEFADDLAKFAVHEGGVFHHYSSGLFAKRSYYSDPAVKRQLIAEHAGKCAFCESFIMDTDVGDVEHFRPKAEVTTRHPFDPAIEVTVAAHPGYFWLSATWENLYLSCKQCNQAFKKNFFDVWPDTARSVLGNLDVAEQHLLLTPAMADGDLRRLIRYDPATASALPNPEVPFGALAERAQALPRIGRTIEIVGLNRPRLREARAHHLVKLRALFVVVASGGGLPANHAPILVTDARPAILDFVVGADSAAADALVALHRAVALTAEFSALALDALIVWTAALRFQPVAAQVALQQQNQIRLQIEAQRLRPQIDLAEQLRAANAASSEAEAEADITDLDPQYTALLRRYKEAMVPIGRDAAALAEARRRANALTVEHNRIREQNGLLAAEGDYDIARGRREQLLMPVGGDVARARQPDFANVEALIANMDALIRADPMAGLIAADNARRAQIETIEEPLHEHSSVLYDINEDLIDLQESYRVRGTSRVARGARCELFVAALASATDWLDTGAVPSAEVQQHLVGRGFPPAIRK